MQPLEKMRSKRCGYHPQYHRNRRGALRVLITITRPVSDVATSDAFEAILMPGVCVRTAEAAGVQAEAAGVQAGSACR